MNKFFKILSIALCLIPLVGFGLCGIWGVGAGIAQNGGMQGRVLFLFLGLVGLVISAVFGFLIRMLLKDSPSDIADKTPPT